jgi:pimeloyl-ACP methyl ester carboxylesterase
VNAAAARFGLFPLAVRALPPTLQTHSRPSTVIVGDADQVEPESFLRREFESRIPGTEFIILPGVGHLAPLEAPDELAAGIPKAVSRMI